jgi:hypothetical protein
MLMVSLLARMPDLRNQVDSAHRRAEAGHCRECGPGTLWPCELAQIAALAAVPQPVPAHPL